MLYGLEKKDISLDFYVRKILDNPDIIYEYFEGLLSNNEIFRYNCFKVLYDLSKTKPSLLYKNWDFFKNLLKSKNDYHKMSAILIIANLTSEDTESRFENIFDDFFGNLNSKKTIVPIYVVKSSWKIIKSKPYLVTKISDLLLNIEKIYLGKQIELVKSAIIEAFSDFFKFIENKKIFINFVKNQYDSSSPKTRRTAKEFVRKWGEND